MNNFPIKKYFFIGFLLAMLFAGMSSIVIVRQPTVGILLQFGKVQKVLQAGLNFRIPFLQDIFLVDTRIINLFPPSSEVVASDQKRLIVNYYVKYKIVDPVIFYKSIRNETLFNDRLAAIVESEVRERIGYVTLIALLKNARSIVMDQVKISANEQAASFGVEVVDVRINKTDLPNENSDAIFKRMQADREKEARELRAEGAEQAKS
ncbi:MAG: protease modulator HflC, partial [Anaplasmataceae bacterium]|nr:protease modulator HflC [Anaplasmataceae bacterium]